MDFYDVDMGKSIVKMTDVEILKVLLIRKEQECEYWKKLYVIDVQ